jgi:hypothetical protein
MTDSRFLPDSFRHSFSLSGSRALLLGLGLSFSFLILYTVGRTPWTGDQPVRPLPTKTHTNIHASIGIRTHDLSVGAGDESSYLRPRGHCDFSFRLDILIIILDAFSSCYAFDRNRWNEQRAS